MGKIEWIGSSDALISVEDLFANYGGYHIYVQDLETRGSQIIKDALAIPGLKIYKGDANRKTSKERWFKHITSGQQAPKTMKIELSNGCVILDYSRFDKRETVEREEALDLIELLGTYHYPTTIAAIIKEHVSKKAINIDEMMFNCAAFRGGAINIVKQYDNVVIPREIHLDYHQMYSYILMNYDFPHSWYIKDGYIEGAYNIYMFNALSVRLKRDGYNLFFTNTTGIEDRKWVNIGKHAFTDTDLKLLEENYDIRDAEITFTLVGMSVRPETKLRNLITEIYNQRKTATNPAIKQFYKLLNENIPGLLERSHLYSGWWLDLDGPQPSKRQTKYEDNIVGVFITSYSRQLLNRILHLLPYDKVIGWDTDAVFFNGKLGEVPREVLDMMGPEMGQLHIDGDYIKTYHIAIKQYIGIDRKTGAIFGKLAGVPDADRVARDIMNNKIPFAAKRCWDPDEKKYEEVLQVANVGKKLIAKLKAGRKIYGKI